MLKIEEKYKNVPNELKNAKRWCLFALKDKKNNDGVVKKTKIPYNPMTGKPAKSNDKNTWSSFKIACLGYEKYKEVDYYNRETETFEKIPVGGLGFMLGDGYFGVDIDNQIDNTELINEFVNQLKSYTEYSQSGKGIHIICKGYLSGEENRKGDIEMYDNLRFFAMTGNIFPGSINEIVDCTERVKPLHEKYLVGEKKTEKTYSFGGKVFNERDLEIASNPPLANQKRLSDAEVLKVIEEKAKPAVINLLNGRQRPTNDESKNDGTLLAHLAFWCDKDINQMQRLFEGSGYFMSKDEFHKNKWLKREDYRNNSLYQATMLIGDTYKEFINEQQSVVPIATNNNSQKVVYDTIETKENSGVIDMDKDIVKFNAKTKKTFKDFDMTDTGNAEHFHFYFQDILHYNIDNQKFLIYDGKTWQQDSKENIFVKTYTDEFINILKNKSYEMHNQIIELTKQNGPEDEEVVALTIKKKLWDKNIARISNQSGKNALLGELKHLGDVPLGVNDLDSNDNELNTPSGIVNLITGEIRPHSRFDLCTMITSVGVSKKKPERWLKFLDEIWTHESILEEDKKELIDFFQKFLGYALTGNKQNEICGIMWGSGGNGKSVILGVLNHLFSIDSTTVSSYAKAIDGKVIANNKFSSVNIENAYAELANIRIGLVNELDSDDYINAPFIKKIASHDERVAGRFPFGNTFYYYPKFKPIIITNHKPKIKDTDDGIWDRVFIIPLPNKFRGTNKEDIHLMDKLLAELPSILWWMIEGNMKLVKENNGRLHLPRCVKVATNEYKQENDIISKFLDDECDLNVGKDYKTQSSLLYDTYIKWCNKNKEKTFNASQFKKELENKGYRQIRTSKGKFFLGIKMFSDKKGHSFTDMEGD